MMKGFPLSYGNKLSIRQGEARLQVDAKAPVI